MVENKLAAVNGLKPTELRRSIVEMAYAGSSVHIGCAFSMVEIVSSLLGQVMNLGSGAGDRSRDRILLSKGHGVMALYAAYVALGWLEKSHLKTTFPTALSCTDWLKRAFRCWKSRRALLVTDFQ